MINFKDITGALEQQIKAFNTDNRPYTITRNAPINSSESTAYEGWVGVYRDSVNYEPYSTGPQSWLAEVVIRIEIQAASFASAEDCEERLDTVEKFVLDALESDKTIGGYVGIIKGYNIEYDDNFATDIQTFYQFSTITVTTEVRA